LSSPLQGVELSQLEGMITNPFHPPPAGSDDPHAGIDLSDLLPNTQIAVAGRTVLAALDGRVAGLTEDRFPYGNALIVETSLADLSAGWADALQIPAMPETPLTPIALTCPQGIPDYDNTDGESLYVLYAHLEGTPDLSVGDAVVSGQTLGTVGMSGNALNPHLHVEIRVGPGGVRFNSLAHYDAGASLDEMTSYCAWRVGGQFRLIDPMKLFILNEK
ncbi:MAG: M23 family metallopeptidase, partial [Anaerolineaceae bacterium]